ncbi:MAG: HNH endonuclease [Candidatus Schekmanbacteria bacterium]|nr:HNH endonuclease [Candidatus Schekmanbacteria bacterium]
MVFALDKRQRPLMPCTEKRARKLLAGGRARVHRLHPFTIRLVDRVLEDSVVAPVRLKLDPGAKTTGVAIVRDGRSAEFRVLSTEKGQGQEEDPRLSSSSLSTRDSALSTCIVLHLAEIEHRGETVRKHIEQRSNYRRRRRSVNLRYRAPRFDNRRRCEGWLPPSLRCRLDNVLAWVGRYRKLCPIGAVSVETVRFDTQAMQNPEIAGIEYQQGELAGYELREHTCLLEKWGRHCAYCGAENVPLQIEHIVPKAGGGSDRANNLTLACRSCNERKGRLDVREFLGSDSNRLALVQANAKAPLAAAAAVNVTRRVLWQALENTGLDLEVSSGGRTKWNRSRFGIPKTHALDVACVGVVERVAGWQKPVLAMKACGRGSYQRTRVDKFGFPRGYLMRQKRVHGFATGDLVRAIVPRGKKAGMYVGRVAVRASGSFNVQTDAGTVQGVSHKHCRLLQRADGYTYSQRKRRFLHRLNPVVSAPEIG